MGERSDEPHGWVIDLWNHVEGQVEFGDSKAGQLLAADSILLAALVLLGSEFRDDVSPFTLVLSIIAGLALGVSLLFVLVAIAPAQSLLRPGGSGGRLWSNGWWTRVLGQRRRSAAEPRDITHFSSIADHDDAGEYVEMASSADVQDVERDLLRSIYFKSVWARHKFGWLDKAVKLCLIAISMGLGMAAIEATLWAL
jgi:hypothetical protein